MDTHVRTLGTLNIVFGIFSALFGLGIFIAFGSPAAMYHSDDIVGLLLGVSSIFHLLLAAPCIIGGLHLRSLTEWSRGLLIVTSALNILNVPLGSLLGSYGLWVLLAQETEPLFSVPPPRRRTQTPAKPASPVKIQSKKAAATTVAPAPRS